MGAKATQIKTRNASGNELSLSHAQSDSPVLDVEGLERLHQFRPDVVDFVLEQTKQEAVHRRKQENRRDWFIFIERLSALFFGFFIVVAGLAGAFWAARQGWHILAGTLTASSFSAIIAAYFRKKNI